MQAKKALLFLVALALLLPLSFSQSVSQSEIASIKVYADAFNASRNFQTPFGPAEQYCLSTGTFLTHQPCNDIQSCTLTANLVCTVSGQQGCMLDVLASHILAYKLGVDKLNAAYSTFLSGYNSFSQSTALSSLNQMDSAFDSMKSAADEVSQSKLRLPDQIACACSNPADCCIGRCPEARFNYTAISLGKAKINELRTKPCSDGTIGGQCSANKPQECVIGVLVNNAPRCGCPANMRPNGLNCEYIPCNDDGATVQVGSCSTKTIGRKCEKGVLVDRASECGCAPGQLPKGDYCSCQMITTQVCNVTNVTKSHEVTYLFDRNFSTTINESFTFEKTTCFAVQSSYTGSDCTQLVNSTVNSTPISETPDPVLPTAKQVACDRCPAVCTRNPPVGLTCGSCDCPSNLGFCDIEEKRLNVTGTPAYCSQELLLPQKELDSSCQQNYECQTALCSENKCTDPNSIGYRIHSFFNWLGSLFGFGK